MKTSFRMTTEIPASITTPDLVETRLGTLRFFDGLPDDETVQKVYDNLDFQRGTQAFLDAMPAAANHAFRTGIRTFGPDNQTVLIAESLLDSRSLIGVANTETIYNLAWLDTREGPLVVEVPPNVLGFINDVWGRFVVDLGNVGPDQGRGGRYLLVPPGYTGAVPADYFVLRPRTYGHLLLFRGFVTNGDLRPAVENSKKNFRVCLLARAGDPAPMNFVDISGQFFNTMPATDASFFEAVAQVVQEEPLDAIDAEMRGLLAAIGIRKGSRFAPDARMQRILAEAVAVGNATARAIIFSTRDRDVYYYPDSAWQMGWVGLRHDFAPGEVLNLDARTRYFYLATGVSPALAVKMVGKGSQYALAMRDSAGRYLDGGKTYRLHLPPGIPASNFWSLVISDPQTRSMLQTDQQFPSTGSQNKGLLVNRDTSVDVYFGPEPPPGREVNWIQTIPGKGWFVAFRLYGPLEPWFDKTWRPGEIEEINLGKRAEDLENVVIGAAS